MDSLLERLINTDVMKKFDPLQNDDAEINKWMLMAFLRDANADLESKLLEPSYSNGLSALKRLHAVQLLDIEVDQSIKEYMKFAIAMLDEFRKNGRSLVNHVNESCKVMKVRILANTSPHVYAVRQPGSFYVEVYRKKPGEKEHVYEGEVYMQTNSSLLGFESMSSLVYIEMKQTFDVARTVIPATGEKLRLIS
jgi:hypothetical protein